MDLDPCLYLFCNRVVPCSHEVASQKMAVPFALMGFVFSICLICLNSQRIRLKPLDILIPPVIFADRSKAALIWLILSAI